MVVSYTNLTEKAALIQVLPFSLRNHALHVLKCPSTSDASKVKELCVNHDLWMIPAAIIHLFFIFTENPLVFSVNAKRISSC